MNIHDWTRWVDEYSSVHQLRVSHSVVSGWERDEISCWRHRLNLMSSRCYTAQLSHITLYQIHVIWRVITSDQITSRRHTTTFSHREWTTFTRRNHK